MLNRKILYEQFSSKEGLFLEALNLYARRMETAWERYLAPQPLGVANIRSYFRYLAFELTEKGDLASMTVNEANRAPGAAVELCREHLLKLEGIFASNLTEAFGRSPEVAMAAKTLVMQQSALSTMGRLTSSPEELQRMATYVLDAVFASCEDAAPHMGLSSVSA